MTGEAMVTIRLSLDEIKPEQLWQGRCFRPACLQVDRPGGALAEFSGP